MSAHPDLPLLPGDAPMCRECCDAEPVVIGRRCPHLAGPLSIRALDAPCAVPADVRRRLVAEYRLTGQLTRARRMAVQFGLPDRPNALDTCGRFGC